MIPDTDTMAIVPTTYQEWLSCFEKIKDAPFSDDMDYVRLSQGSFAGTDVMIYAFQQQLINLINTVLNKSTRRFVRNLNECLMFHELEQLDFLFKRLKKDIHRVLFFRDLTFLSDEFISELYQSVKEQMTGFWNNSVGFLQKETMDHNDPALEDALYLIGRITLFSE